MPMHYSLGDRTRLGLKKKEKRKKKAFQNLSIVDVGITWD